MKKIEKGGRQGAVFCFMEGVVMLMGVLIGLATTGERRIDVLGVLVEGVADAFKFVHQLPGIHVFVTVFPFVYLFHFGFL